MAKQNKKRPTKDELDIELVQGVLNLLSQIPKNTKGECITSVPSHKVGEVATFSDTLYLTGDGQVFLYTAAKEKLVLRELSNDRLFDLYSFLEANSAVIVSREHFVEHEEAEMKDWEIEPQEVKVGETVIAKIGVAVEEVTEGGRILSMILISADSTWCTLAMWNDKDPVSSVLAKTDLTSISGAIQGFVQVIKSNG